MALTETDIKIIIAAELKKAGFDKAQKATTNLEKSFKKLGKTATRTFVAVAGIRALKQSVQAFAAEEKAAIKLAGSLRNLGLAYNTKAIEDYLEKTEKATGISKDDLSPAIQGLINTTLSAEKSMSMLNIAMDIAASTGKDLRTVTTALIRAYDGNFAALGKVQTAYTAAELKALGFNASLEALASNYSGSAQRNADSYAGKIDKLAIAFGDAKEEIGKGVLSFLESLGDGDYDQGLQKLVNFGSFIGDAFRRAGLSFEYFKTLIGTGFRIDEEEARKLAEIRAAFNNPDAASNRMGNSPAANRAYLRDMKQQQQLQKKIEADRKKAADLAAKTEKERLKREKEAAALKRAGTVFDIENIQIIAALQGKISEEQRLRLTALLAIQNDNAKAAEALTLAILASNKAAFEALGVTFKAGDSVETLISKIIKAQAALFLINTGIGEIPKAKNPFEDWTDIIAALLAQIGQLRDAINGISAPSLPVPGGTPGGTPGYDTVPAMVQPGSGVTFNPNGNVMIVPPGTSPEVFDNPAMWNPEFDNTLANPQLDWTKQGDTYVTNVTVGGSVISDADLVQLIQDEIYNAQKSGGATQWNYAEL